MLLSFDAQDVIFVVFRETIRFIERMAGATNSHYVWLRRIDLPIRFAKFVGNMLPGKCAEVRRVSCRKEMKH